MKQTGKSNNLKSAISALLLVFLSLIYGCGKATANTSGTPEAKVGGKTLVVYFSWGGNTRAVAEEIRNILDCDILEVETAEPYPDTYTAVRPIAYEELEKGSRPLNPISVNPLEYDTIIVGSPIWGGHIAPPLTLFLKSYDLSGKTILPFSTHQGSGLGRCADDIQKACPQAHILKGQAIHADEIRSSHDTLVRWLKQTSALK